MDGEEVEEKGCWMLRSGGDRMGGGSRLQEGEGRRGRDSQRQERQMRQDTHLCIINIITHTRINLPSLLSFDSLEASHISHH